MTSNFLAVLIVSPLNIFLFHVYAWRFWLIKKHNPQMGAAIALTLAWLYHWLVMCIFWPDLMHVIYSGVILFSVAFTEFHIFNMGETGRRIRILHELRND